MDKHEMAREVGSLASGTLSRLFKTAEYAEIETRHARWINWVKANPEGTTWPTWQDCWYAYHELAARRLLAEWPVVKAAEGSGLVEYQIYGVDAVGNLVHAGIRAWPQAVSQEMAQADQDQWENWAYGIALESPDCPTAQSLRTTVKVVIHPVGLPHLRQEFPVTQRRQ